MSKRGKKYSQRNSYQRSAVSVQEDSNQLSVVSIEDSRQQNSYQPSAEAISQDNHQHSTLSTQEKTDSQLNTIVPLNCGVNAVLQPLSANDFLLFQEKAMTPRTPGASARAIGRQAAVEWLIRKAYKVNDKPLTADLMDEFGVEVKEFNQLLYPVLGLEGEVTCHDNATDVGESDDFSYEGHRVTRKPISWRYALKFQDEISKGAADAYRNMITSFFEIDSMPITPEMMASPDGVGVGLTALIFQRLGKCLN
ncbi:MAG: hypothetical protein F6K21_03185 [Symploca sp. SIO2D2]|nr:hypothetical protein [Symploca sp. SIO2D2]